MRRFAACLFDLDGTLLDTLRDLAESVNEALRRHGFPEHPLEAYRYFVGDGARMLVTRALPADQREPAFVDAFLAEYRSIYEQRWNIHTRPYAGVPELLDALVSRGLALGILSNKPHEMTQRCVEGYLSRWPWKCVLGQRESVARKPDPSGALEAAERMGVRPEAVLYVGDTATDILTARAAGMFSAGATWGFRPESELREAGADRIVHHPRDVLNVLDETA